MRDTVYMLVFEGFADWQVALALSEIRRPGDWNIRAVGFTTQPVVSASGLRVLPDDDLDRMDPDATALLMLPGGRVWQRSQADAAARLARRVHDGGAPVAAIGEGVLAAASAGLLDHCRHTGDGPGQIAREVPAYSGEEHYDARTLAASDRGVVTASHLGNVEFAREVIRTLDLYGASDREHWYRLHKHAIPLPWFSVGAANTIRAA